MAASDLIPALQAAVSGFNTVVDGKQPTLDAKLPTAQAALDGARVSRDGALVARDATILSRDAAYRDLRSAQANLEQQDLAELAASKALNAVDVFIYDTSKDSDGGAWRKRCAKTSWFNETLNTATRGARREFPAVAVIVAEATKVTIYDGDDPTLPMWMVFSLGGNTNGLQPILGRSSNNIKCVAAKNGTLAVGCELVVGFAGGLRRVIFPSDDAFFHSSVGNETGHYAAGIAERNDISLYGFSGAQSEAPLIAGRTVNDVAMTVLPGAPVYPAAGLPVPTIAVATEGGVSVINDDGSVTDSTDMLSMIAVGFDELDGLFFARTGAANHCTYAPKEAYRAGDGFGFGLTSVISNFPAAGFSGIVQPRLISRSDKGYVFGSGLNAYDVVAGVARHVVGPGKSKADFAEGMSALLTSTYATGWLPGDIRGAFLSDTDATDLVGGTDADRSVHNNPLTVNGTIIRAPVATGAEIVAYSGFSASNYLEQPYNSGLDFGTGDFCVLGWVYSTDATYRGLVGIEHLYPDANGDTGWVLFTSGSADVRFRRLMDGAIADVGVPYAWPPGWSFFCVARIGATMRLWTNGSYIGENSHSTLAFDVSGSPERTLKIGRTSNYGGKRAALFRISATVPDTDQIHRIYQDEKVLFQKNAACTLYGASDAVTALAHDPDIGLLHVGTSAGRSVFKGLRRVDNTTQPVTTAISAANGMVIEQ